ncbi:MAG: hypothetical protein WD877_01670 [Candidatus Saccharimonadales bacterium]
MSAKSKRNRLATALGLIWIYAELIIERNEELMAHMATFGRRLCVGGLVSLAVLAFLTVPDFQGGDILLPATAIAWLVTSLALVGLGVLIFAYSQIKQGGKAKQQKRIQAQQQ